MEPNVYAFGTRARVARECRATGEAHVRRVMRDATGATEFEYCAACGARRYPVPDAPGLTAWDSDALWRQRFHARRCLDAMIAAAQATHPRGRESGRREAIALAASWLGQDTLGSWLAWSEADCQLIDRHATPILIEYSDLLVTGAARHLLHASRARTSAFPRLMYRWLVVRDAVRHTVAQWVAQWHA